MNGTFKDAREQDARGQSFFRLLALLGWQRVRRVDGRIAVASVSFWTCRTSPVPVRVPSPSVSPSVFSPHPRSLHPRLIDCFGSTIELSSSDMTGGQGNAAEDRAMQRYNPSAASGPKSKDVVGG